MNIFYRPQYKSDITQFIEQFKAKDPGVEVRQREGMALLWNKEVDRDAWGDYRAAKVDQQPYVYQTVSKD